MNYIIVGLGNPGSKYAKTRHNIGWLVCDALVSTLELSEAKLVKKYEGRVSEGMVAGEPITVLYPETFMNSSGTAVRKLVPKGAHDQLIVIYDDVDLPTGDMKISYGNGAGGHNGVASIIETLGTRDFVRVRVGVAQRGSETGETLRPNGEDLAAYVLGKISPAEQGIYEKLFPTVVEAVVTIITDGKERAMNKYN